MDTAITNVWLLAGKYADARQPLARKYAVQSCKRKVEAQGYTWNDMTGRSRLQAVVDLRHCVALWLYRSGMNYTQVGNILHRDHATIIHAVKKCNNLLQHDVQFRTLWGGFRLS